MHGTRPDQPLDAEHPQLPANPLATEPRSPIQRRSMPSGSWRRRVDQSAFPASRIADARSRFVDALKRGDVGEACVVYAAHAQLLPPFAPPVEGRPNIAAYWQAGIDAGMTDVEL